MKERLFYQFAEEAPAAPANPPKQSEVQSEYQFEGYTVVINEKIVLTPVKWHKKKKHG